MGQGPGPSPFHAAGGLQRDLRAPGPSSLTSPSVFELERSVLGGIAGPFTPTSLWVFHVERRLLVSGAGEKGGAVLAGIAAPPYATESVVTTATSKVRVEPGGCERSRARWEAAWALFSTPTSPWVFHVERRLLVSGGGREGRSRSGRHRGSALRDRVRGHDCHLQGACGAPTLRTLEGEMGGGLGPSPFTEPEPRNEALAR